MMRTMFKSKIHRATVTQADLHYVGSVTIDEDLLDAADLLPGELVHIVDIDNGARLETYTIAGPRGTGIIGINGAAARLVHTGDLVIIIAYAQVTDEEARDMKPRVVFVDGANRITGTGHDPAEAPSGSELVRGDVPAQRDGGARAKGKKKAKSKAATKAGTKAATKAKAKSKAEAVQSPTTAGVPEAATR